MIASRLPCVRPYSIASSVFFTVTILASRRLYRRCCHLLPKVCWLQIEHIQVESRTLDMQISSYVFNRSLVSSYGHVCWPTALQRSFLLGPAFDVAVSCRSVAHGCQQHYAEGAAVACTTGHWHRQCTRLSNATVQHHHVSGGVICMTVNSVFSDTLFKNLVCLFTVCLVIRAQRSRRELVCWCCIAIGWPTVQWQLTISSTSRRTYHTYPYFIMFCAWSRCLSVSPHCYVTAMLWTKMVFLTRY